MGRSSASRATARPPAASWRPRVSWFASLRPADLAPALDQRLALADRELDAAVLAAPDTATVLAHLDRAARHGQAGYGRTATLWAVHPDAEMRTAATAAMVRYE